MAFTPATDFVGISRQVGTGECGTFEHARMPPLDFVAYHLNSMGYINIEFGDVAPAANQEATAWVDTAADSHDDNGAMMLWDGAAYVAATPQLFGCLLAASSNCLTTVRHGVGVPVAPLGNDKDYYIRTDAQGGVYFNDNGVWGLIWGQNPDLLIGAVDELGI